MDLGLKGKVAIVAASSKGLGRATATVLAREGALVTVNGRDAATLAKTAQAIREETGGDVIEVPGDMTNPADVQRLIDETVRQRGGLDILVCNAGGPPSGTFSSFPDDEPWLNAVNLNLMSTLRLSRAAIPHLEARGGGSITNIVSISVKQPIGHLILSNTARTAVIGLAKSMSLEFAEKNIRINNICPGSTLTDRITSLAAKRSQESGKTADEILAEDAKAIPMGRLGTPEEFANVVVFFASPAASYVTGVTVQVDGGAVKSLL
ncbi:MAG: 3-oxoacyl-[acyl-carrier protein] reductase [Thermomicrobiales bacterium]|nr:3-oxoacyl-[acyl-carrier protein] reductase [Thermomicrobiales bacterium]